MKDLKESFRKLGVLNVTFSSSSATFEDTKNVLGDLKAVKSGVFDASKDKMMLQCTSTFTDNPQLLFTINESPTHSDGYLCGVQGVAMLDKYLCVVYYEYDKVQVFDCEDRFKKIKEIQVNGISNPCDIVGCSVTAQLFISDYVNGGNIFRVNVYTGHCDVFIQLGYLGARLSLVENRLLVKSHDSLLMYDIHSGQVMKKIPRTGDLKKYRVYHAIESNKDSFFVSHGQSDDKPKTVSEINSEGLVIRVFANKEQLNCEHLALDSVGRLLVTVWNNRRVVLLDEHLELIRILFDKERLDGARPFRLSYNKNNNKLAVGLNIEVKTFDCNAYCK